MYPILNLLESNIELCLPPFKKPKGINEEPLGLSEIHFQIKDVGLTCLRRNPSQDGLRLQQFVELLKISLPYIKKPLDCEFILNMYEGIYEDVSVPRFTYTAKPNTGHILIPDSHCFETARKVNILNQIDIPMSQKKKAAVFAGSDTGNRRKGGWTMRSLVSETYRQSTLVNSKLTSIDGDFEKRFFGKLNASSISAAPMSMQEQLKYQIILNINGNSTSWERLLWAMASNSLCVFVKPFDGEEMYSWYYPLMETFGICPYVEYDRIDYFIYQNDFENDFWKEKKRKQKEFAALVSSIDTQAKFLASALTQYNDTYNS